MSGEIAFTPTPADWIAANRLWYAQSRSRRLLRWVAWAAAALVVVMTLLDVAVLRRPADVIVGDVATILLFALLLGGLPLLHQAMIPRQVRRQFKQRPGMADETRWHWSEEGLKGATRTGTTVQPWAELHRQLHDDASFLFLMTDNMLLMIPRRALSVEADRDLADVADRLGPPIGW